MTPDTPPVLYISADTSDLTTRYKATPRMHMGADARIPRDAVRVKPLVWGLLGGGFAWRASTGFSALTYRVEQWKGGFHLCFSVPGSEMETLGKYPTIEDAKAAAQADYEARIMSALAALPAPDEGEQEEEEGEGE